MKDMFYYHSRKQTPTGKKINLRSKTLLVFAVFASMLLIDGCGAIKSTEDFAEISSPSEVIGTTGNEMSTEYDNDADAAADSYTVYLLSSKRFFADGEITHTIEYTYDPETRTLTGIEGEGSLLSQMIVYNEYGQITESYDNLSYYYNDSGVQTRCQEWYKYTYDAEGNLQAISMYYGTDDSLEFYNEICGISWTCTNNLLRESTYDAEGNLLTEVYYNNDGEADTFYRFEYVANTDGNIVTEIRYAARNDGDEHPWYFDYTYDTSGNVLSKISYSDSNDKTTSTASKWEYTYDTDGNLLKEVCHYSDSGMNEHTYTYDTEGNILTETQIADNITSNGIPIVLTFKYEYQAVEFEVY